MGANCYPSDRQARQAWLAAQAPVRAEHPAPEVPVRIAYGDEVPSGARRIMNACKANGWQTIATYARGTTMTAQGRPGKVVDSIMVRGARYGATIEQFSAVWLANSFDVAYVQTPAVTGKVGARELRQVIDSPKPEAAS